MTVATSAAWFDAQPVPPASWAGVVAAVRAGAADASWATLDGGAERLIPATVAHAALPPPWLGGHPPRAEIEWDEGADDRDRWAWWVFDTFEDIASWRVYLARWPPPSAWQVALAETLFSYSSRTLRPPEGRAGDVCTGGQCCHVDSVFSRPSRGCWYTGAPSEARFLFIFSRVAVGAQ